MVELVANLNTQAFFLMFNLGSQNPLVGNLAIFGAEYLIFLVFAVVAISGLFGSVQDRKALVLSILAIPFAVAFIKLAHLFLNEPRPFTTFPVIPLIDPPQTPSFPSLHTTWTAVAAIASTFYKTKFAGPLIFMMLFVGISRILVGVHYPLDVLGGFLVGLLAIFLAWQVKNFLGQKLT